jgi:xylulokinase
VEHVIAHDVGTSGLKTALVNTRGEILASRVAAYPSTSPQPGWFEQEPADYWNATVANTRRVLEESGINRDTVLGMAFSTQAMGIIAVNAAGQVLHPNIAWVDGRAEEQAAAIMRWFGGRRIFRSLIGIEISGKDVIPKLKWLRQHRPAVYDSMEHVLDVNGYLKFRATGRRVFEWSGACSYGFNLRRKDWDRPLFRAVRFDMRKLPPLVRSIDRVGTLTPEAARELDLPTKVAVFGGCDDTQSAALGCGSTGDGAAHLYLGSSAWAGVTTYRPLKHRHGAVCVQSGDPAMNLVVGVTESAGANLNWFLDRFYPTERADPANADPQGLINRELDRVPPGSAHLIFTPWLMGERCPVTSTTARGTVFNVGLEHSRAHFLRALLEGIGYNLRWILDQFGGDFGFRPATLRATGGGAVNDTWLQGIADITGRAIAAVERPTFSGTLGAAACALVGSGRLAGFNALEQWIQVRRTFQPDPALKPLFDEQFAAYREVYRGLKRAYRLANQQRFLKHR